MLPIPVYRTFPLKDPRLGSKKLHHLPVPPHPSSSTSESVGSTRPRNSDTDIALQNLAKLNVSNKGMCVSQLRSKSQC